MNVLIAPDKYKGCLSAREAARAMARGVKKALPAARVRLLPVADGGDGTAEILTRALGGRLRRARVRGPRGAPVRAVWGYVARRRLAVIEMATASGLALLPRSRRNPLHTTTYGAGQLVRAALDLGCREIILGLGGSATVDAGLGFLQALGAGIRSEAGPLRRPAAGQDLLRLRRIDLKGLDGRLKGVVIRAACDVTNPLHGPRGAAFVYGPQKGATPNQARLLNRGLRRFARLAKRDWGKNVADLRGAGAAGGLGAALAGALNARLESGADLIFSRLEMRKHVRWADVVLTGEGNADAQSADGKAVSKLAAIARRSRKPLIVLAGAVGPGAERLLGRGVRAVIGVSDPARRDQWNFRSAARNIARTAEKIFSIR